MTLADDTSRVGPTPSATAVPPGYALRRPAPADAAAVAALRRAAELATIGETDVVVDQVREEWALPRLDHGKDLWVVDDDAGDLVGYGFCWLEGPPYEAVAEQVVHPSHRGRGLSELLLELEEARATELAGAAPPGGPLLLGVWAHESDAGRLELYDRHGYRRTRSFLRLARDIGGTLEPPEWPLGITVAGFRRDRDEAAVHAAEQEAFLDHFRPTTMDLDEWVACRFLREDLDLALWSVAWDDDEVAGSVHSFVTAIGGYVEVLFVRRPWRGRGLGRALLLHAFAQFRGRGLTRAYLGVDAFNPTGAMRLYGSVGLESVHGPHHFFEKEMR